MDNSVIASVRLWAVGAHSNRAVLQLATPGGESGSATIAYNAEVEQAILAACSNMGDVSVHAHRAIRDRLAQSLQSTARESRAAVFSAVDIAVRRLSARVLGVSVDQLLGGRMRDRVDLCVGLPLRVFEEAGVDELLALGVRSLAVYADTAEWGRVCELLRALRNHTHAWLHLRVRSERELGGDAQVIEQLRQLNLEQVATGGIHDRIPELSQATFASDDLVELGDVAIGGGVAAVLADAARCGGVQGVECLNALARSARFDLTLLVSDPQNVGLNLQLAAVYARATSVEVRVASLAQAITSLKGLSFDGGAVDVSGLTENAPAAEGELLCEMVVARGAR